jgi:multiple sugar transport system permease protein
VRRGTFLLFVFPSVLMMGLFIAVPLVTVAVQSFANTQRVYRQEKVENCSPGFPNPVCTTEDHTVPLLDELGQPQTRTEWVGLANYAAVVQPGAVAAALGGSGLAALGNIDFFRALRFTLTFTLITLPLVIVLGLCLALALNATGRLIRGPVIFASLLPFIVTPVIGALSIRWLFDGDGILTAALERILGHPVSMLAHDWTLELLMMGYRVWSTAPFAFVIFYAGLQGVNQDTIESAVIDGASRWERLRHVVLPHLAPLILFVALIHLMDAYRVFDEVVGFSSQAYVISLQWLTFDLLTPNSSGIRAIGRASASSMLTMAGIVLLLTPLLVRSWRDRKRG